MIVKSKFASVYVNEEKEITAKKDGKKYKVVEVNCKVDDSMPDYAGKYMKKTFWGFEDKKDPKKSKTPKEQADYFKEKNVGVDIIIDVTETKSIDKDKKEWTNLSFRTLNKKEAELAKQFIK